MRICIFGAGAIGGYLAVGLVRAGLDVSVIARGEHLAAIQNRGLTLLVGGEERRIDIRAVEEPEELGAQDLVICALKAHQAYQSAERFVPLLGPATAFLNAMNGFPWWYFYKAGGSLEGRALPAVDPGAKLWRTVDPSRAIGCIVEPACEVVAPGVILHRKYNRFTIGEPDGTISDRIAEISAVMTKGGFEAPIRRNIRQHIWLKLWGNASFNPISVLTMATIDRVTTEPALRALCRSIMIEARDVAIALGVEVPETMIERRLDAAAAMLGHKMSMLQDLERGRQLELGALVEAVSEAGRLSSVPTPTLDVVLALARERAVTGLTTLRTAA